MVDYGQLLGQVNKETPMAGEDTRQLILEESLRLFQSQGYRGTVFDEIGRRLSLSRSAIAWHYRTKSQLLDALTQPLLRACDDVCDKAERGPRDDPARLHFLDTLFATYLEHRPVVEWLLLDVGAYEDAGPLVGPSGRLDRRFRGFLVRNSAFSEELRAAQALGAITRPLLSFRGVELTSARTEIVENAFRLLRGGPD